MSRIGKQPVPIPEKVKVDIKDTTVSVEGPRGKVQKTFAPVVTIAINEKRVVVAPVGDSRFANAMYGTARSIIAGMVKGVTVGYSHPLLMDIPDGIKITVTDGTKLKVEGCDKQLVGAVTAEIRSYYPPEPYKGKGVRIVGERVRRKEGKTVA